MIHVKPLLPLALAASATALLLSLMACATVPPPRPVTRALPHHPHKPQRTAAVLTPDARGWCEGFGYSTDSHAFAACLARWQRSERYQAQAKRAGAQP